MLVLVQTVSCPERNSDEPGKGHAEYNNKASRKVHEARI
jgi:hypothetical protein